MFGRKKERSEGRMPVVRTWRKVPRNFSRTGNCLGSAVANGVNHLCGEQVIDGEEVLSMITAGGRKSCFITVGEVVEKIGTDIGRRFEVSPIYDPKKELSGIDGGGKVLVVGVNLSRWERLAANEIPKRLPLRDRMNEIRGGNHAVLVYGKDGDDSRRVLVHDRNWDGVFRVPGEDLARIATDGRKIVVTNGDERDGKEVN